jgi:hypothetical protein
MQFDSFSFSCAPAGLEEVFVFLPRAIPLADVLFPSRERG